MASANNGASAQGYGSRAVGWQSDSAEASSIVMYNLGVGPRFAYVSASARPQNNKLLWGPSKLADI